VTVLNVVAGGAPRDPTVRGELAIRLLTLLDFHARALGSAKWLAGCFDRAAV